MALECNIDARGKAVRIKLGIFVIKLGIIFTILTFFKLPSSLWNDLPVIVTIGCWITIACMFLGGMFSIWEGRKGWCIVRAMGFKTKI